MERLDRMERTLVAQESVKRKAIEIAPVMQMALMQHETSISSLDEQVQYHQQALLSLGESRHVHDKEIAHVDKRSRVSEEQISTLYEAFCEMQARCAESEEALKRSLRNQEDIDFRLNKTERSLDIMAMDQNIAAEDTLRLHREVTIQSGRLDTVLATTTTHADCLDTIQDTTRSQTAQLASHTERLAALFERSNLSVQELYALQERFKAIPGTLSTLTDTVKRLNVSVNKIAESDSDDDDMSTAEEDENHEFEFDIVSENAIVDKLNLNGENVDRENLRRAKCVLLGKLQHSHPALVRKNGVQANSKFVLRADKWKSFLACFRVIRKPNAGGVCKFKANVDQF